MFYLYRCTTDKLAESLNTITQSGDSPVWPVHTGGRDWVIVCRKGSDTEPRRWGDPL